MESLKGTMMKQKKPTAPKARPGAKRAASAARGPAPTTPVPNNKSFHRAAARQFSRIAED
jgi:hypothetical protein